MTSRDHVINTLCHQIYAPIPTFLSISPLLEQSATEACDQLRTRFSNDLEIIDFTMPILSECRQKDSGLLRHIDDWGCLWEANAHGVWNYHVEAPYEDLLELEGIRFPGNPVTASMLEQVEQVCDQSSRFVLVQTHVQPFRRLCALGGVENAKALIRKKPRELKEIATRFFDYYMKQINLWCGTSVDAIGFSDDLADENGIRMSIPRWNEIFVPMLREFCNKVRACDKFVYFTGNGDFEQFIPGLIFAGVDAIRYDATAMDSATLVSRYGKRVTFQPILKPEMIEQETEETLPEKILALRTAFGETDIIAECQLTTLASMRKVTRAMLSWRRRMPQPEPF